MYRMESSSPLFGRTPAFAQEEQDDGKQRRKSWRSLHTSAFKRNRLANDQEQLWKPLNVTSSSPVHAICRVCLEEPTVCEEELASSKCCCFEQECGDGFSPLPSCGGEDDDSLELGPPPAFGPTLVRQNAVDMTAMAENKFRAERSVLKRPVLRNHPSGNALVFQPSLASTSTRSKLDLYASKVSIRQQE